MTPIDLLRVVGIGFVFTIGNLIFPSTTALVISPVAASMAASVWTYSVVERNKKEPE